MIRKLRMFQPSWGVGQPQQGLSGPAHGFILGLPSVHPKDGGLSGPLEAGPVICHPLLLLILLSPQTRHKTCTRSLSHTCVNSQVQCLKHTVESLIYTQPVPKLSAHLGYCAADNGLALQLGDLRVFGCSSFV